MFYLKRDVVKNWWMITNQNGDVVSGPKYFQYKYRAVEWAENFCSSFRGAVLKVGRK